MTFAPCDHAAPDLVWSDQQLSPGNSREWHDYRQARCPKCDRPLVAFAPGFPPKEMTFTRRHVAWAYLGKEGEHAGNTRVMPWPLNAPRADEPEVIKAQLQRLRESRG
jgi:hypothetical protein